MVRKSMQFVIALAIVTLPVLCRAQAQQLAVGNYIESARAEMQADRTKLVGAGMNLSDKDGATFWPIYRSYQYERSTLDDHRAAVIKEYAVKYSTLNDADAKAMAERMLDCESDLATLKKKYFKKFNAALPALTVAKFFQLEHRIDLLMDMKVESSLPPLFTAPEANTETGPPVDTQTN